MSHVLDAVLVALLLLTSLVYAATSLGPPGVRRGLLKGLSRLAASAPGFFGFGPIAARLNAASAAKAQGACGGCDNCADAGDAPQSTGTDAKSGAVKEISVPVAHIGRRNA